MNKKSRMILILNNDIDKLEKIWARDHKNNHGRVFWRDIPSDEAYDNMFGVFEKYYDVSNASFRDVCKKDGTCSLQVYGVNRR